MEPNSECIKEIFSLALQRKSPAEREHYLSEACRGDADLRQQVESLIEAHDQAGEFLGKTVPPLESGFMAERAGAMIGRYKLLERIGEGGFGTVWMAEQDEPVRRRVALKVIKAGMDTRQVLARFEAERQALAMMDHPSIARVFDGGATDTGRPYFVMELVRGTRITDYCDANRLSTPERLMLFIQVCRAVQHAHQKGIIHRDLKPSNILVTEVDASPVPKVIDFGVVKATQGRLTDLTLFTGLHQMVGTPAYMSPEQAGLGALDMDTRSDIYALGVLLYELLTSQTPLTKKDIEKASTDEIFRLIREQEPPRPSTRLRALTREELTTIAARRQTEPVKLNKVLKGDLDWIVMKCLEKNRTRRYESASGLARDVQRHLNNEPVTASPPSVLYRFQKLVRRRRIAFAAWTAFFVVVFAVGLHWWFLPGTLNLDVTPADAQIEIDGQEYRAGPMPRRIKLSAGAHQVRFHKTDFTDEARTAIVPRGDFVNIPHLTLKHQEGTLDVESSPPGTGIQFEGVDYYSAIKERPTDTGVHEVTGFGDGFFEKSRVITIKRNERLAEKLSLEKGVSWKYQSPEIQGLFVILTNTGPDQPAVIVHCALGRLVFFSSADGSVLDSIPTRNGNRLNFYHLDLGADVGQVMISPVEEPASGPTLTAYSCSWPIKQLWKWEEAPVKYGQAAGVSVVSVPHPDSVSSVAFAGQDGHVRWLTGRTGKLEQDIVMATNPPIPPPSLAVWNRDGRTYMLGLFRSFVSNAPKSNELMFQGVLTELATARVVWRKELGMAEESHFADLDHTGAPGILLWDDRRWRLFDAFTGDLTSGNALPGRLWGGMTLADAEGRGVNDLILQFTDPKLPMLAVRPSDGATIWQGPTNLSFHPGFNFGVGPQTTDGAVLVPLAKSLAAVDAATGKVRWELGAKPSELLADDQTGDIYVTLADRRLVCLDRAGRTNWILRLAEEVAPRAFVPALQPGGPRDILLTRHAGLIEMVHAPRLLWEATATGPLQATPLVVKGVGGQQVVVQMGPWGGYAHMVGLDGATSRTLWSNKELTAPNRAPNSRPVRWRWHS
jgi:serine/threonine protein kinase